MRKPDKPGTFRIVPRDGSLMLSGVRPNGERLKIKGLTRDEAEGMAARMFPREPLPSPFASSAAKPVVTQSEPLDDFGLPPLKVSASVVASAAPVGAGMPPVSAINPIDKARKQKNAQSLMELVGMGWAAGTVMGGRKLCEKAEKEPVKPSPKQVNDLADSAKDTLTDWFGDRDIKPWQMTILLTLAIPMSMLLQSPKKKLPAKEGELSNSPKETPLRSV